MIATWPAVGKSNQKQPFHTGALKVHPLALETISVSKSHRNTSKSSYWGTDLIKTAARSCVLYSLASLFVSEIPYSTKWHSMPKEPWYSNPAEWVFKSNWGSFAELFSVTQIESWSGNIIRKQKGLRDCSFVVSTLMSRLVGNIHYVTFWSEKNLV